jgi:hypothetical protein
MSIDYDGLPHVLIRDDDVLLTWQGAAMTEAAVQTVRDRCVYLFTCRCIDLVGWLVG